MTNTAYTGLPGSGKSYEVVANVILPALKSGRRVWTNIPMNHEELSKSGIPTPTQFKSEDISNDPTFFQSQFEKGALIVIDEAWVFWPSGMKSTGMHMGHKSFFAEHRHMVGEDGKSTEIVLITQDLSMIAANVRALVSVTYRMTKMIAVGKPKNYRVDIYDGAVTGNKPPKSGRLRSLQGKYKIEIYKYYKSQTMSDASGHGDETLTDGRINIFNSKFLKYGAPAILCIVLYLMYTGYRYVVDSYVTDDAVVTDAVTTPGKVRQINTVIRKHDYLNDRDITISYNAGHYPYIEYRFRVIDDDEYYVDLGMGDMYKLGYKVTTVNDCLVKFQLANIIHYAQCVIDRTNDDEEGETFEEFNGSEMFSLNSSK